MAVAVYIFQSTEDTLYRMKVFFLILSMFFLYTATQDCCLTELTEEIEKIELASHNDEDHQNEADNCEECQCSTFCSYNLLITGLKISVPQPQIIQIANISTLSSDKEVSQPFIIFHPPIA